MIARKMIARKIMNLLWEYQLHEAHWLILKLVEAGPVRWDTASSYMRLKEISGQPAHLLRHLVERELLTGPVRGEVIRARPFELSELGREVLGKIERGLHRPEWLSEHKVRALEWLAGGQGNLVAVMKPRRLSLNTLRSLQSNGYINSCDDERLWEISDLGKEALREWSQWRAEYEQLQSIRETV